MLNAKAPEKPTRVLLTLASAKPVPMAQANPTAVTQNSIIPYAFFNIFNPLKNVDLDYIIETNKRKVQ